MTISSSSSASSNSVYKYYIKINFAKSNIYHILYIFLRILKIVEAIKIREESP